MMLLHRLTPQLITMVTPLSTRLFQFHFNKCLQFLWKIAAILEHYLPRGDKITNSPKMIKQ